MTTTPPEHVAARWNAFIDYLRDGKLPFKAARAAGVPHKALAHRLRSDPDFEAEFQAAMAEYAEEVEQIILDAALAGEPYWVQDGEKSGHWETPGPTKDAVNAAEKWLKARQRALWAPDKTTTVNHNVNVEITGTDDVLALQARLRERQRNAVQAWTPGFLQANPDGPADAELVEAEEAEDEAEAEAE